MESPQTKRRRFSDNTLKDRNEPRSFWHQQLKKRLPKNDLCNFFRESFADNNLQFCWEFFQSLYAIFIDLKMNLSVLKLFDNEILKILRTDEIYCPNGSQIKLICQNRSEVRKKNYSKYYKRINDLVQVEKYNSILFSQEEHCPLSKKLKQDEKVCSKKINFMGEDKNRLTNLEHENKILKSMIISQLYMPKLSSPVSGLVLN
jgi:hypothetical protein